MITFLSLKSLYKIMAESSIIQFIKKGTKKELDLVDLADGIVGAEAINPTPNAMHPQQTRWRIYYDMTKWRPRSNGIDSVRAVPIQIGMIGGDTLYKVKTFEDLIKRSKELLKYIGTNPKPGDY